MIAFAEGLEVYYNGSYGIVRFICDQYITICTSVGDHRSRDICIVVYRDRYNRITLKSESEK